MKRALALVWLLACGDDASPAEDAALRDESVTDAGEVDGGIDATPDAAPGPLDGPEVAFTGEEVCFTSALVGESFRFSWGDGERSDVTEGRACHVYAFPGEFLVGVQVGAFDTSRVLQVVPRPAAIRPESSSPLLYDAATHTAWVANTDAGTLGVIDLGAGERIRELAVCRSPRTLARSGRVLAVACQDDVLVRVDADGQTIRSTLRLPPGSRPFGVVGDPRVEDRFIITLQDAGQLALVEAGELASTVNVGPDPRALSITGEGALLVTRWRGGQDGASVIEGSVRPSGEIRIAGDVLLPRQEGLDSDTDNSGVPSFLDAVVFTPGAQRALVPALKANNVTGAFRTGGTLTSQTTARGVIVEVFRTDGPSVESFRRSFDDLDYASALTSTALGDRVFVALMGAQRVVALSAFDFNVVGSIANVGIAPRGLAIDRDGRLLIFSALGRELRAYDVSDLSTEPAVQMQVQTVADEPLSAEVLRGKQLFFTSVDPRMSRTSYLSCASCHLDGESDGLVWDFTQRGEGLRNTISLLGRGGANHGPMHWSGNFDEVQDFENDIRAHQGGLGFLSDEVFAATSDTLGPPKAGRSAELDALDAYLSSLRSFGTSPFRREENEAERARGAALFAGAGCADCHSGANYTDSALDVRHDVGTLGEGSGQRLGAALDGLDTPTLRGLWRSAPYLHDGSAPTLRSVLRERNADDRHGRTSDLDDDELDALELFLLALDDG